MLQLEMSRVVRTVCRGVGRDYISFYFPSILAVWGGGYHAFEDVQHFGLS